MKGLGVEVHHEGVGPAGAVSWLYAVSAVFMPPEAKVRYTTLHYTTLHYTTPPRD